MQQPNGQLLWAAWWFLVSKLTLKWKSRNIWYLPLEEWWCEAEEHFFLSIHEGVCASFLQLLNLGFHSPYFDVTFGLSAVFWREREEQYHIEGQCHMKERYHISAANLRDPASKSAVHGARPAVPVLLLWSRSVCARSLFGVWLCWPWLLSLGGLSTQRSGMGRGGGRGRKLRAAWAGHLVVLGISAPSHVTTSSSYKE